MAFDDVVSPDPVPTTRRAVLRTGVKLAYAAPVVAASMKLAEQASSAQVSGPTCTPSEQPCELTDPGACCSLCCRSLVGGGPPAVCC
jgi:hypothetical protein